MIKLIILLMLAGFFTETQAQRLRTADVPDAVTATFNQVYATVENVDWWSTSGNKYMAKYYALNNIDMSVTYEASGRFFEKKEKILITTIPAPISDYMEKNQTKLKIRKAFIITDARGNVFYQVDTKKRALIFDSGYNLTELVKD